MNKKHSFIVFLIALLMIQCMPANAKAVNALDSESVVMAGNAYYSLHAAEQYVFMMVRDDQTEFTNRENLLYIDQKETDEAGSVSFVYPVNQQIAGQTVIRGKNYSSAQELAWELDSDNTLKISGFASIQALANGEMPWSSVETQIKKIWIDKTVQKIESEAFAGCSNLTCVEFSGDAPTFSDNCFKGSEITVLYPSSNPTWTQELLQNYGGTIIWHFYCTDDHSYANPIFKWDEDYSCIAEFACQKCDQTHNIICNVTSETVPAEGENPEKIVYTAMAVFNGDSYTDIRSIVPENDHKAHAPSEQWYYDSNTHWKLCVICDEKIEVSEHTPGSDAASNTSQFCAVCSNIIRLPLGLNWILQCLNDPGSYVWATGYYTQIMEQYSPFIIPDNAPDSTECPDLPEIEKPDIDADDHLPDRPSYVATDPTE